MDLGKATLGVVGGGQLGRMMAWPAHRLGVKLVALDAAGAASPCAQVCGHCVEGGHKDAQKTALLVTEHKCNVVTVETEHVNAKALEDLEKSGTVVQPSPKTIALIQDKFLQKEHFAKVGTALPKYMKTDSVADVLAAGEKFGFPLMLKARGNSYDGKGNYVVKTAADAQVAFDTLNATSDRGTYAEGWAEFTMELAVMVVRGINDVRAYPVVEVEGRNSICHITVCPARIPEQSRKMAEVLLLPGCFCGAHTSKLSLHSRASCDPVV
jgi:phosphoribosylaminoimidazole carboxylase